MKRMLARLLATGLLGTAREWKMMSKKNWIDCPRTLAAAFCGLCLTSFGGRTVEPFDAEGLVLPGETMTNAPLACAPFPDRLSACVWKNWFVVPHDRLASVVGAREADLEEIAGQMGLPRKVNVLPQWHRRGYITIVRRNWHLLDYPQLMELLQMTRRELFFCLQEDDFLWHKLGRVKPRCGALRYGAEDVARTAPARRRIAEILREEKIDDFAEEPRFAFVDEIRKLPPALLAKPDVASPFGLRLCSSYFADYGDPLADPDVRSFPEGLLARLAAQGVNAVWLQGILNTLTTDPKYPEFGAGSAARRRNLQTLVDRAARYGIRVYLYLNEPRAQPTAFFGVSDERRAMKGVTQGDGTYAMCTSHPETLRWVRDAVRQLFSSVHGLGGVFTITMSENLTNCASRGGKRDCPRCRNRPTADLIAEVNLALIGGMRAGDPKAEALVWNWTWPDEDDATVLARLPKEGCRVMTVSEDRMNICRGGVPVRTHDYSISCVGPSDLSRRFWRQAKENGLPTVAKIQANTTWELASVPYLPVMDLVAEHASNLVRAGVGGVMLSWSLGGMPAPNLRVFGEIGADGDRERVLDRIASELYGAPARPAVRRAWTAYSDGFRNFPFSIGVVYNGPMQMGPANLLYPEPTGYRATMVCFPYDDVAGWCAPYPPEKWIELMQRVADGFEKGDRLWRETVVPHAPGAARERGVFRLAGLHFASSADQARFVLARQRGDAGAMRRIARAELLRAHEALGLVRADSRLGYESSNHYFFIPQDLREKIVSCRNLIGTWEVK